jgi:hypothetical protein
MLRNCTILILLFSLVFQSVQNLGFVALYRLNKKFIAEKLCENKSRPQMHCEGKCCLKKQLAKSAREEKDNKSSVVKNDNLVYEVVSFFNMTLSYGGSLASRFPTMQSNLHRGFHNDIFHPPLS